MSVVFFVDLLQLGDLARAVDTKIDRTEAVDMIAAKPDKRELLTDMRRSTASLYVRAELPHTHDHECRH